MYISDISNGLENVCVSLKNEISGLTPKLFTYTPNCVLTSSSLSEEFESIPLPCHCKTFCNKDCPCHTMLLNYGQLSEEYNKSDKPVMECSILCSCEELCSNKGVQNGIQYRLEVFLTEKKGFGVRALENIPKFSFVCEYAGELIDSFEAQNRIKRYRTDESNYIYVLKEYGSGNNCIQTIIDPTYVGNVGRFVNHSCSPNLIPFPVRVNSMIPKMCFFAKQDIQTLEELTYNYGGSCNTVLGESSLNHLARRCSCDSPSCCGYLPFVKDWLI